MALKLKLGFDNYAVRALGWKAPQLLDYAASLHVDTLLLSDLDVYERLDDDYLRQLKSRAGAVGVELQAGTLSICRGSVLWHDRFGTPEEHLRLLLRVARALGSPVARCVLGIWKDRGGAGGIAARKAEVLQTFRAVRSEALDSGVKFALENHAGDMQSWEVAELIEAAGRDFVGATLDAGNATWAMENPMQALEVLGPYALTTGIRDSMLCETADGATLQWTAMGEGVVDWKKFFERFAFLCPNVPVILETISGRPNPMPFLTDEYSALYPQTRLRDFTRFLALVKKGKPIPPFQPRDIQAEQEFQKAELERSLRHCREALGLGFASKHQS